jgi:hypothetical protein
LGNWWVQQGVALGARFPPVSIKDYLLVAIWKVWRYRTHNRGLNYSWPWS